MSPADLIIGILQAVFASIAYSISVYFKRHQADGEPFKPAKFLATLVVGIIVGVAIFLAPDSPLTPASLEAQLAAYAGVVMLVENLIKIILRSVDAGPNDPAALFS